MVGSLCKSQLRFFLHREETECRRDHKQMEEHLYECIYDIQRSNTPPADKPSALNSYKARLVCLLAHKMEKLMLDTNVHNSLDGEELTLFQVLKMNKWREERTVGQVMDRSGNVTNDHKGILHTFVAHYRDKYSPIDVNGSCVNEMLDAVTPTDTPAYTANLEQPITRDEIVTALKTGGCNKAPGSDGIGQEFYTAHWDMIHTDKKFWIRCSFTRRFHPNKNTV